jgi:hypothetical protein
MFDKESIHKNPAAVNKNLCKVMMVADISAGDLDARDLEREVVGEPSSGRRDRASQE